MTVEEIQELHCHNCNRYVQFRLDLSINGNHVITCPNCRHEHCRVVQDGKITDIRWGHRNQTIPVSPNVVSSTLYSTTIQASGTSTISWAGYSIATS